MDFAVMVAKPHEPAVTPTVVLVVITVVMAERIRITRGTELD